MRSLRILLTSAIGVALLLGAVPFAAAQSTQVVPTTMTMNVDLLGEGSTLDRGDVTEGFVTGSICWDQGGFNPLGGKFMLKLSVVGSPPAWLDVRIAGGDEKAFTPPFGPEPAEGCRDIDGYNLRVTARDNAPYGERATLDFAIDVSVDGDVGTYMAPESQTGSGAITISADPGNEELPNFDNPPPPPPPPAQESPALPVFVLVLGALVAARIVRRRS
jgi:hypothetical protein